ncbi:hypothetical protein BDR05DRAFT_944892 [Suillus weaverae]|nr:hypothetical protein BDR05DRAFT_944892 [Suillus weaverae]
MASPLYIEDILQLIIAELASDSYKQYLARLAQTSLNSRWSTLTRRLNILCRAWVHIQLPGEWESFDKYARRVQAYSQTTLDESSIAVDTYYLQYAYQRISTMCQKHLFPNLRDLVVADLETLEIRFDLPHHSALYTTLDPLPFNRFKFITLSRHLSLSLLGPNHGPNGHAQRLSEDVAPAFFGLSYSGEIDHFRRPRTKQPQVPALEDVRSNPIGILVHHVQGSCFPKHTMPIDYTLNLGQDEQYAV